MSVDPPNEYEDPPGLFERVFPAGTARREVATQAMGGVIAAYIILLVVCLVGVEIYSAELRDFVLKISAFAFTFLLVNAIIRWITRRVADVFYREVSYMGFTRRGDIVLELLSKLSRIASAGIALFAAVKLYGLV